MTDLDSAFEAQQIIHGRDAAGLVKASERRATPPGETVTAEEAVFVMHHGAAPEPIDPATWRLRITGLVDRPLELGWDDLQAMGQRTVRSVMECAGNGRASFVPPIDVKLAYLILGDGTVASTEWTGVPLRDVLALAGSSGDAVQVVATPKVPPEPPPGAWALPPFQKGLPVAKAMHPDTILAWRLGAERVSHLHGGPVRLVVPGWYAVWWTKWLVELEVTDQPWTGYFQTERYTYDDGTGDRAPVAAVGVTSMVASPRDGSHLDGGPVTVEGYAWSGHAPIALVEISTDDGATWSRAALEPGSGPWAWTRWRWAWDTPVPGPRTLLVRAADAAGNVQPSSARWNAVGYGYNAITRLDVTVAGAHETAS